MLRAGLRQFRPTRTEGIPARLVDSASGCFNAGGNISVGKRPQDQVGDGALFFVLLTEKETLSKVRQFGGLPEASTLAQP